MHVQMLFLGNAFRAHRQYLAHAATAFADDTMVPVIDSHLRNLARPSIAAAAPVFADRLPRSLDSCSTYCLRFCCSAGRRH